LPCFLNWSQGMSNIVLVEMPAYGHVNPSLPVVRELVRRGEQVVYFDAEEFRPHVERAGATFRVYPAGVLTSTDIAVATQSGDLTRVPGVILRATESLLPFLLDELPRLQPDVVVLDSNALWGHMAANMLHLPRVSLMTTFMLSSSQFMRLRPLEWIHMGRPMLSGILRVVSARSRLVRRFGKATLPKPPLFPARGGLNLSFLPRDFQPDSELVDDTFRFVGPMIDPEARRGDVPLDTLGPEPVVYISLGTLHRGSADFFRQCFAAFADVPARFVLSVGTWTDSDSLGAIPSNFVVRPSVPQLEVLEQAAAFVTHGGMNSVLEGLWCAVPLMVIPQHVEQLLIGLHVAARGAGLVLRNHVAGKRVTAAELRRALGRILAEPSFHEAASAMQRSLHQTGGYRQAVDEIQAYLAQRQPLSASKP
jgi:hypothetical protein